jgi:hypothetical protein
MQVSRSSRVVLSIVLVAATIVSAVQVRPAYAAQITNRSLTLQAGASDGGAKPGGVVNHLFNFNLPSSTNVGSIQFTYCTTASGTCTLPAGLVTTNATLGTETGATGFTINKVVNGTPYLTRTAAAVTPGAVSYQLRSITNPTTTNQAFFVRIATYTSTDTTGSPIDTGTVTASTANDIILTGTMPESLIFCTGATVGTTNSIPDCTKATAGSVTFNQLFSPTDTATASSQMAASTNATTGFNITVAGTTLTSGVNTIAAMNAKAAGTKGLSQFGMNLKANTTATSNPAIGTEISPIADSVNFRGQAATGYDTVDNFKFTPGESVANSAAGGAGPTNSQIYTSSYIVNVSGNQPAGTYTTTLTYVCTATF